MSNPKLEHTLDRASDRSTTHATFVIERQFSAPIERVFAAWSDATLKRQWNSCHDDWRLEEHSLDFRLDGTEINKTVEPDGTAHVMKARFLDIVPNRRVVYAYDMHLDEARISVSLVTLELERVRSKTKMTFTEQVVLLDGHGDAEERRLGTEVGLGHLQALLGDSHAPS
jgi:uncharacterized protein YndB with AHSA1/START domain